MAEALPLPRFGCPRPVGRRSAVLAALVLVGACAAEPARSQASPPASPPLRAPEAGLPFLSGFAPSDYGAAESNWAVEPDARGVVYAGNGAGVLEYDGATWRLLALPNRGMARSLARDGRGRVWVGGVGDLGYLAPDARGRMTFVSLREHVPTADRDFDDVWSTHATAQGVYFRTTRALFRWDGRAMHVWRPTTSFHSSFLVGGVLYVRERERGLLRMETAAGTADRLRLVPGGERFAQTRIYALLPFDGPAGSRLLVGTREEGLFVSDGARFVPFASDADGVLAESGLYVAAALPGGRFALGTRWRGLHVIDRRGRLVLRLDRASGLPDDTILALHADGAGTLWVGLSSGLARVELDAPATRFGEANGTLSTPLALARHEGRLVAANAHGGPAALDAALDAAAAFRPLRNGPSHSPALLAAAGDLLLAGSNDGLQQIRGGRSEPVPGAAGHVGVALALHAWGQQPQTVFVGDDRGLAVMRRERAGWVYGGRVPGLDLPVRRIAEAPDGALWVGGPSGRLARVRLPRPGPGGVLDLASARVALFGAAEGLPEGLLAPYRVGGGVYVSALGERLFRYDEAARRFVDDRAFDGARGGHPLAQFALREDADGRVWVSSTYGAPVVARPRAEGGYAFEALHRLRQSRIHDAYPDADGVVWLMGARELVRYDTRRAAPRGAAGPPLVRRVSAADSLLYDGAGAGTRAEVPHEAGAVRFAYAAPGEVGQARYRTRLDGFDPGWSDWSEATERTYTNLPPGRYRFLVEAEGRAGAGAFGLAVRPPWYRTGWAMGLFGASVGLLLLGTHRTRTRHLRHRQQVLEREVAERTQALRAETRKTEQQAERLREMDRVKSRLFVNVSHEFRTPLTLTIGPLEDLQAELARAEPHPEGAAARLAGLRRHADLALRNSRRLLRLINQLLDVAKLEAGDLRLDARRQDLTPFVRGIARSFEPLAERRRVRLAVSAPPEPVAVCFDDEKLEQVLVNLLSNAFKFTPEGGSIQVALARETAGGVATVAVRDSGPGIAPEALPRLFERFYQAEPAHSEVQPGTGIGLSLAKDLAELHGGTITAESAPGLGATFTVRLPLAAPLPVGGEAAGDGAADGPLPTLALAPAPPEGDGATAEPAPPDATDAEVPGADERTTVLVADDNAEIRAYVRGHLEGRYRVLEAADGAAALALARAALPDLIVSDVMMPALDGLALVRALRADPDTDFLPVVLLTARATEADRVEGLGDGADAYLAKPFSVRELHAVVEGLIASRQRLRARFAASPPGQPTDRAPRTPDGASSADRAFLARVRAAIEAHVTDEDFGVEALAAAVGQSRSTLHRRLREALGQSPVEVVREVRLERAAGLLRDGCGTVSEVAYAVGFRSVSHFCHVFRDAHGVTPSAYAARVRVPTEAT